MKPFTAQQKAGLAQAALFKVQKFHAREAARYTSAVTHFRVAGMPSSASKSKRLATMHRKFIDAITPFLSVPLCLCGLLSPFLVP